VKTTSKTSDTTAAQRKERKGSIPIQLLLLEDEEDEAFIVQRQLKRESEWTFIVTHVTSLEKAVATAQQASFDCALLDLSLPDAQGLESVTRFRSAIPNLPIVVRSGKSESETAMEAMDAGAQDYVVKGTVSGEWLGRVLRYAVERHTLTNDLIAAQREQTNLKDQVLAHVSHEFRNPLSAILGSLQLIQRFHQTMSPKRHAECIEVAIRNTGQLKRLTDDLFNAMQKDAGKLDISLATLNTTEALLQAHRSLVPAADTKSVGIVLDVSSDIPDVYADPHRLQQILMNLGDNAIKFTPKNASVLFSVRLWEKKPRFLHFTVSDSGPGIAPENREHIFERLFQTHSAVKSKGLGLGLFICRELVQSHGGEIWVTDNTSDTQNQGASFHFTMPAVLKPSIEEYPQKTSPVPALIPLSSGPNDGGF